jgi:hydroxyacylglutathione hydrolase
LIDPAWDGRGIAAVAAEQGWTITHILLTHAHFDHVGGLAQLKEETGAPVYIHTDAVEPLRQAGMAAALWGIQMPATPPPDVMIAEGDIITVGRLNFHVLFTPGHAPGHVSFYLPDYGALFDGDVLFEQGIGRTDLPGGDYAVLMQSIREKILTLPDETDVFPGHGAPTIVGEEREWNPFLD